MPIKVWRDGTRRVAIVLLVLALHAGCWKVFTHYFFDGKKPIALARHEAMSVGLIPAGGGMPASHARHPPIAAPQKKQSTNAAQSAIREKKPTESATPTPPHYIDYGAIGRTAKEMAKETARRPLPGASERLSPQETLGRNIAKGARKDCQTAYSGLSILAIPLLVRDAMSDTGCRW